MKAKYHCLSLAIAGTGLLAFTATLARGQQLTDAAFTNTNQLDATGTILAAGFVDDTATGTPIQFNGGNSNAGAGITFDPSASPVNGYGWGAYPYPAVAMLDYSGVSWAYKRNANASNGGGGQGNHASGGGAANIAGTDSADADNLLDGSILLSGGGGAAGSGATGETITLSLTGLPDSAAVKVQLFGYMFGTSATPGPTVTGNTGLMGTWTNNYPSNYKTNQGGYYAYDDATSATGTLSIQVTASGYAGEYFGAELSGLVVSQPAPVPEPASFSLAAAGVLGMLARRRDRDVR